jgi:tripartite ATP-independent transporter DctP family solute receptor
MSFRHMGRTFLLVLVVFAVSSSAFAATEFKLGHFMSTEDAYHVISVKCAELTAQYTNNAIRVNVFPGGQLGSDRELTEGVMLGTIEATIVASGNIAGFEPKFMVFDLPFLFRDEAHGLRVLDGPIGQRIAALLEPKGIKLLSWGSNGFRNMITVKKKVANPDDMRGLKFRVMESPVFVAMFKSLGATGVPIAAAEIYTSLQSGVVDGYEHPVQAYKSIKAYEVAKLVALTGHAYTPTPLLMNLKLFNSQPKTQQDAILKAAREAALAGRAHIAKSLDEQKAQLRAVGVEFNEVDKRLFQQKMADVYKQFEPQFGKDLIEGILKSE